MQFYIFDYRYFNMTSREKRTRTPSDSPNKSEQNIALDVPEKTSNEPLLKRVRSNRLKNNLEQATKMENEIVSKEDASKSSEPSNCSKNRAKEKDNSLKAVGSLISKLGVKKRFVSKRQKTAHIDSNRTRLVRSNSDISRKKIIKRSSLPLTKKGESSSLSTPVERRSLPARKTKGNVKDPNLAPQSAKKSKFGNKIIEKSQAKIATTISERLRKCSKTFDSNVSISDTKSSDLEPPNKTLNKQKSTETRVDILEQMAHNFSEIEMSSTSTIVNRRSGRSKKFNKKEKPENINEFGHGSDHVSFFFKLCNFIQPQQGL